MKKLYHFTSNKLRDGRPIPLIGQWLEHDGDLVPCKAGLHASAHPFDALKFASGKTLHLVELGGEIIPHNNDKVVARRRKILKTINADDLLRKFARRCALDSLKYWPNAPEIVKKYIKTGDESIRAAAWAAARAAAGDAAGDAAWAAARDAAWAAAGDAARAAARDAAWAAARAAAGDAAWAAAERKYRKWFKKMVDKEFNKKL